MTHRKHTEFEFGIPTRLSSERYKSLRQKRIHLAVVCFDLGKVALPPILFWVLCGAPVLCMRGGCGIHARERALGISWCVTCYIFCTISSVCTKKSSLHPRHPLLRWGLVDFISWPYPACIWDRGYKQGGLSLYASMCV